MTCSTSSGSLTPVQSTCKYVKYPNVAKMGMSVVFTCPVSYSLVRCVATDTKCTQVIFELQITNSTTHGREYISW